MSRKEWDSKLDRPKKRPKPYLKPEKPRKKPLRFRLDFLLQMLYEDEDEDPQKKSVHISKVQNKEDFDRVKENFKELERNCSEISSFFCSSSDKMVKKALQESWNRQFGYFSHEKKIKTDQKDQVK